MTLTLLEKMRQTWAQLYSDETLLNDFIAELHAFNKQYPLKPLEPEWYKDVVVYCLYVDQFNTDFNGLTNKLPYLQSLGITCLWLLPILDSPLKDYGFDIRDYRKIRKDLLGLSEPSSATTWQATQNQIFVQFIQAAHRCNIRVIFDIAMNHTSNEHQWFQNELGQLRQGLRKPDLAQDYYIWSATGQEYLKAPVIFNDEGDSIWHRAHKDDPYYYLHRFFKEQPDLNYRNPKVLLDMCQNLLYWVAQGVDGFRADAIPFLWKEEGTDCESLPQLHILLKFFRLVLDFVRPHTLILAEAVLFPEKIVEYFGQADECQAAYHFPLMSNIYLALAKEDKNPIERALADTPAVPKSCQWFSLLRCHDSLPVEIVEPEERKGLYDYYCHDPKWGFMEQTNISARLSDLFKGDAKRIDLINSILLTLIGTPIIYYGDEFALSNDVTFWQRKIEETGHPDSRFLVRGKVNWDNLEKQLNQPESLEAQVFSNLKKQLKIRQHYCHYFGQGEIAQVPVKTLDGHPNRQVLAYRRFLPEQHEQILVLHNLSAQPQTIKVILPNGNSDSWQDTDLFGQPIFAQKNGLYLPSYAYQWILLTDL
jgi:maltose alpha-D-glucosyltransferase/alpha-amylase